MSVFDFMKYCIRGIVGLALLPFLVFVFLIIIGNAALNNLKYIFVNHEGTEND